jgi:hypothetical protein
MLKKDFNEVVPRSESEVQEIMDYDRGEPAQKPLEVYKDGEIDKIRNLGSTLITQNVRYGVGYALGKERVNYLAEFGGSDRLGKFLKAKLEDKDTEGMSPEEQKEIETAIEIFKQPALDLFGNDEITANDITYMILGANWDDAEYQRRITSGETDNNWAKTEIMKYFDQYKRFRPGFNGPYPVWNSDPDAKIEPVKMSEVKVKVKWANFTGELPDTYIEDTPERRPANQLGHASDLFKKHIGTEGGKISPFQNNFEYDVRIPADKLAGKVQAAKEELENNGFINVQITHS